MRTSKLAASLALAAMLASCGGGTPTGGNTGNVGPTPTPSPSAATCSLTSRQNFTRDVFNEWYLFPTLLNLDVNQASHSNLQSYIDALVAPARAQSRDRFFSYVTSIRDEEAFFNSGSTAGFGFRLNYDTGNRRLFVIETFEGTSALGANIDRGSEILGIGTNSSNIQSVSSLMASGGAAAVSNALGPNNTGVTRVLRVRDQSGVTREVTLGKTNYALDPVSDRYGAQIINDGSKQVGYLNLRTFIDTADPDLRAAFANFRNAGVTELIIDFRYNGGGAISIADLMGDLMGVGLAGEIFESITWRDSKSSRNDSYLFAPTTDSIAPTKIAFIGTDGTASASELVINSMQPWVSDIALIGENTFGKPVGQSAFDLAACDDRLRVVTIRIENALGEGDYYTGLASTVPNTCSATDDISRQMGDPQEAMTRTALDWLAGRACTPISARSGATASIGTTPVGTASDRVLLTPDLDKRSPAQHEVPGLF